MIAACARCHGLAEEWWRLDIADVKSKMRMLEFDFYGHLTDEHPMVHPRPWKDAAAVRKQ